MVRKLLSEVDDQNIIEVTPQWMKENYIKLNQELFGGALGPCRFGLFREGKKATTFGLFFLEKRWGFDTVALEFNSGRIGWGVVKLRKNDEVIEWDPINHQNIFHYYNTPRIELSALHKWTEKAALSTLVHEMCHYYVDVVQLIYDKPHGKAFKEAAMMVDKNSGGEYSYKRIIGAEEVSSLELSDYKIDKDKRSVSGGVHILVVEYAQPIKGYNYGYEVPATKNYEMDKAKIQLRIGNLYKRAFDYVTTDPKIVQWGHTNKPLNFILINDPSVLDEYIKIDSKTELSNDADGNLDKPYYIIILKRHDKSECEYFVVKSMSSLEKLLTNIKWLFCGEGKYDRAEKLAYFKTYDPRIRSHQLSNVNTMSYWVANDEDSVLPWCKKEGYKILYSRNQK